MKFFSFCCLFVFLVLVKAEEEEQAQQESHHKEEQTKDNVHDYYVVNGQDADPHEWPWQVMLLRRGTFICGGSLISDKWVLTAAHCVEDYSDPDFYSVIIGAHKRLGTNSVQKTLAVKAFQYHHLYDSNAINNDVALLLLNETISISNKIRPIKLPAQGSRVSIGKTCYVTGWGRLEGYGALANTLQEAPLIIGSYSSCKAEYSSLIDLTMVCAGQNNKGSCNGDSGGPLSCYEGGEWILRGVVSYGIRGCSTNYFSVFARVSTYINWISSIKNQQGSYDCTFENGLCLSWHQDHRDVFDWTRHQGSTRSSHTGPSIDHTTKTSSGWYMYIETSSPRRYGDTARLVSMNLPATNETCLTFWYHMYGKDINTLRVLVKHANQETTIWSETGNRGDRWIQAQISVTRQDQFQVIFQGVVGQSYEGDIAVDDIAFVNERCKFSVSQNCNFESGICSSWNQDKTDVFDWTRHKGSTFSSKTGPSVDHTTGLGSGWYMYIETSSPRRYGETARLVSKTLPATNQTCITFWFHMFGSDVNALRVLVKNGNQERIAWNKTGNHGNRWIQGQVGVTSNLAIYEVIFEGVVGTGFEGDIAIDDIAFLNGTCNISESCHNQRCHNGSNAYCSSGTYGKHCEFAQYNCTFENGTCSWYQDRTDNFDWIRYRGPRNPASTGPSIDHTKGTILGYYMYIYSDGSRYGKAARLISRALSATNQTCLSFWYHMYGNDVNTLRVLVKTGRHQNVTVWSRTGESGDRWLQGQVTLTSKEQFQVIFEAVAGKNYNEGDIAIDDITFVNGICNISDSCQNQTCSNGGHVYCLNNVGYCYCSEGVYGKHCELVSRNCTFEKGVCSFWNQDRKDVFDWTRHKGSTLSSETGPSVDHTTRNVSGWYMYIETSSPRSFGDTARLVSKTLPATKQTCISFWYHMYGKDINTLRVLVKKGDQETTVWTRTGNRGDRWLQEQVSTITSQEQFQIVFEGVAGSSFHGDIAVDDIFILNGTCDSLIVQRSTYFPDFARTTVGTTTTQVRTTVKTSTAQVWTTPQSTITTKQGNCISSLICYNGGTPRCYSGQKLCDCPPSYTGSNCQHKRKPAICPVISCLNNGTMVCALSTNYSFCQCTTAFKGHRCQIPANGASNVTSGLIVLAILLAVGGWNIQ